MNSPAKLERTLGPVMLWGLGVGYVISGTYFGWNLGLPLGGTYGLAVATIFVIIMALTFTFSYTELACAIPKAGGAFDYAKKALGPNWGFIGGMAQIIEFVFAPPAIAAAIGAYFHIFFPQWSVMNIAIFAYLLFTGLNIYGIKASASFELGITILATLELFIFSGVTWPHFEVAQFTKNPLPNGWMGVFPAIPFAMWFFLGIEGVANVAEETVNPQRNVVIGFGSAIFTLIILCLITFSAAVGVAGWEAIVYPEPGAMASDSPLPLALRHVVREGHYLYHLLVTFGLLGLIASFNGIILAAGRATFEFGRVGYAPAKLGAIHSRFHTPTNALLVNMAIGIVALATGKTGEIIILATFGAMSLYVISMISVFKLRKSEPQLHRPFKVPYYPYFPAIALVLSSIALVTMVIYNFVLALIYFALIAIAMLYFKRFVGRRT